MPPEKPKPTNSQIFKAYWSGVKPQAGLLFASMFFFVVSNAVHIAVPVFYKDFFDILQTATDKISAGSELIRIISIIAIIHLFAWIFFRAAMFLLNRIESQGMAKLRQDSFNHIILHSHTFFADNFSGSLVQKIGRFSRALEGIIDTIVFQIFPLTITVVGAVIVTFNFAPFVSLVIAGWVLFFLVFNLLYSRAMVNTMWLRQRPTQKLAALWLTLLEIIAPLQTLSVLSMKKKGLER